MSSSSFLFGAATSSHQVEGNNIHNDWWAFEQTHPGFPKSGLACDHWNRWREDLVLAKQLGHTAHRFSLEWSRIEPKEGQFNRAVIEHYREVLLELKRLNMKSFVTLHHFTNPQWFALQDGWLNGEAPDKFVRYVKYVAQQLAGLVDFWVTINEPNVYASQSYFWGKWPPMKKSSWQTAVVFHHMITAHRLSYRAIHSAVPSSKVGIAQSVIADVPARQGFMSDLLAVHFSGYRYNHYFLRASKGHHDFIGLNYYFARCRQLTLWPLRLKTLPIGGPVSDMGWTIFPKGLTQVLIDFRQYKKPLYVTENGIADADDSKRADFIRAHLKAVEAAQAQGADVRGYLHWSLLDNFEWADGFKPRFGLIEVDYATQARHIRPSAYVYKAIIEQSRNV